MKLMLDSFWRAAAYLLRPRVIGLSLLPLLIAGGLAAVLGYFYWEAAVAGVRATMENLSLVDALLSWLDRTAGPGFRAVIAPLVVVTLALPLVVLMTPAIVSLVAERRFADLERRKGAALWQSLSWSLGWTLVALLALVLTLPLWFFVPPLMLLIPPLIWGWLTTKVMAFDVLADHATAEERRTLLKEHAWPLLIIGVVSGYLGAAPSLIWAASAITLIMAPVLVPVAVWLYTLVFAFSALWFAHYALAALNQLRQARSAAAVPVAEVEVLDPTELSDSLPPVLPPA